MISEQQPAKPEGKKLRRKLQKINIHHRNRQSHSLDTKTFGFHNPFKSALDLGNHADTSRAVPRSQPSLILPSDLSDNEWVDQLRKTSYFYNGGQAKPAKSKEPQLRLSVVPELAHLNVHETKARKSTETSSSTSPRYVSTPASSSASSAVRRYAKTPVFRVGQLESKPTRKPVPARKPVAAPASNVSSIEIIAESYRALLDPRSSMSTDKQSEPGAAPTEHHAPANIRRRQVPDNIKTHGSANMPASKHLVGSPTSDDGTLVGFEEDAIYFKPVSMSEPSSPSHSQHPGDFRSMGATTPDNPGLQICFDLLRRELTAAAEGSPPRPGNETSALQIWTMIEAYEKLRDQVSEMGLGEPQVQSLRAMLDMWLDALHTIHDRVTGHDGQASESDYGDFELCR